MAQVATTPAVAVAIDHAGPRVRIESLENLPQPLAAEITDYLHSRSVDANVSIEHDPRWLDVFSTAMGHRTFALVARSSAAMAGESICGFLPLSFVSSRLMGRFLVSLPYLNRAGVLADNSIAASSLIDRAAQLAGELNAQYLELRHGDEAVEHSRLDTMRDEKVRMVLALPQDHDFLWKTISAKVRNQIRKGQKHDLAIAFGGAELVSDFYDVFSRNMRDLGTPVYPKALFEQILSSFDAEAELAVVRHEGDAIAGALLLHDDLARGGVTQVPSASCLRLFNHTNANMWMYFHLLKRAIDRGSEWFDFGRSSVDSGTYRFKKQWGATASPTIWQYHTRRGSIGDVRPDNPKFKRRIEMWKRLPLWATRILGPRIVRGIP